jgi:aspartate 1-decarboxylase
VRYPAGAVNNDGGGLRGFDYSDSGPYCLERNHAGTGILPAWTEVENASSPLQVEDSPRHSHAGGPGLRRFGHHRCGADARCGHADILPFEKVHIWNRTNGSRLETYALEGAPGSGVICVNGAAAHHAQPGDIVIIATFAEAADEAEARAWTPKVVHVDAHNRIVPIVGEVPGPERRLRTV